ncbi:enoyl-CoA-hydratase DpgB [Goodfellowiella coeruleoviolacea]|nr:enoyl-CoA-hydratase DpgB [Goodfellowiella coeruleoviolacea]
MSSSDVLAGQDVLSLDVAGDGSLSQSLLLAVNEFCDRVQDAPAGTVAVLRVGGDRPAPAASWPGDVTIHAVNRWERALRRLERLGAVTVAVAAGRCTSPDIELLLATDYRIATPTTSLALPADTGEFWPGMLVHRLATQIGVARTRQLLLRAPELAAARAVELGLVDEIAEDVATAVERTVASLRAVRGPEFAIRRRLLLDAPTTSFEEALGVHLAACDRTLRRAPAPAEARPAAMAAL